MKIIEIVVSPAGKARVETRGFRGNECCEASEFIEKSLGKRNSQFLKAEFYNEASVDQVTETSN